MENSSVSARLTLGLTAGAVDGGGGCSGAVSCSRLVEHVHSNPVPAVAERHTRNVAAGHFLNHVMVTYAWMAK